MNSKALYAVMLALLLPIISYFIVKHYSDKATVMPPHYYADSVIVNTKNGKQFTDTIWHRISDFSMTNQLGKSVSWDSLRGKIVVADFFFTHCPTICVPMARNMKRLQESITNAQKVGDTTNPYVQFLSFSIDPERDSVPRLKYWADRFQINPEKWWLLTGDKKAVYNLALNEMKLGMVDGEGVDSNYTHSDKFVLIDSSRNVRGYYSGLDSADLAQLSRDLVLLTMEKNPKAKNFLAGQLQLIVIAFLIAMIGVGLFLFLFRKKSK
ncbi:MAG TPA: SCO family protein [Chitinophagaceae bacterium]|jgi:protein SCO1/2|nr:SCO family protein [Chitinophagaceae bacterium]